MGFALVLKVEMFCSILQVQKDCSCSVFSHIARDGAMVVRLYIQVACQLLFRRGKSNVRAYGAALQLVWAASNILFSTHVLRPHPQGREAAEQLQ